MSTACSDGCSGPHSVTKLCHLRAIETLQHSSKPGARTCRGEGLPAAVALRRALTVLSTCRPATLPSPQDDRFRVCRLRFEARDWHKLDTALPSRLLCDRSRFCSNRAEAARPAASVRAPGEWKSQPLSVRLWRWCLLWKNAAAPWSPISLCPMRKSTSVCMHAQS